MKKQRDQCPKCGAYLDIFVMDIKPYVRNGQRMCYRCYKMGEMTQEQADIYIESMRTFVAENMARYGGMKDAPVVVTKPFSEHKMVWRM